MPDYPGQFIDKLDATCNDRLVAVAIYIIGEIANRL
jgi:hypothetical protein